MQYRRLTFALHLFEVLLVVCLLMAVGCSDSSPHSAETSDSSDVSDASDVSDTTDPADISDTASDVADTSETSDSGGDCHSPSDCGACQECVEEECVQLDACPDTGPICGDGVVEGDELCDGDCPTSCDDGDVCTEGSLTGSVDECDATCTFDPITQCIDGDGCCSSGCTFDDDDDCEAPSGTTYWAERFGGADADFGSAVAAGPQGDVVMAGRFGGTVDFGGSALTADAKDIFVAGYDASGTHKWSKSFGGASRDAAYGVAVDGQRSAIVTGQYRGSVDFGGGPLGVTGGSHAFFAKYDTTGAHQWSSTLGGAGDSIGRAVATDSQDHVIVCVEFSDELTFDTVSHSSAGWDDVFVAKFNDSGDLVWETAFGSTQSDTCGGLAVDGQDNIYMTGAFGAQMDVGGQTLTHAGSSDIYLTKFAPDGSLSWAKSFGDSAIDYGLDVAIDGAGDVIVAGEFREQLDLGAGAMSGSNLIGGFVAQFAADGSAKWSQHMPATSGGESSARAVAAAPDGTIMVTGYFSEHFDHGTDSLLAVGTQDGFVATLDASGTPQWAMSFGGSDYDRGGDVEAVDNSRVVLSGWFSGTVDFGGGDLTSDGDRDVLLLSVAP